MPLSAEVMRRVAARADQRTKVSCCLSSKAAFEALTHPASWRQVVVYKPGAHALEYLERVKPEVVDLVCSDVPRVEAFLDGMVARCLHLAVRGLGLTMENASAFPRSNSLLTAIAEFDNLVELAVWCTGLRRPACLAFPRGRLRKLRLFTCKEVVQRGGARRVEVYFDGAELPVLEEVHVHAATSDIMGQVCRLVALKAVVYSGDRESFEDASLADVRLDHLAVDVSSGCAMRTLCIELSKAKHIEQLVLTCGSDACLDTYLPVRNVFIKMRDPGAELVVVHSVVRGLGSLRVEALPPSSCQTSSPSSSDSSSGSSCPATWRIRFIGVGSWYNFQAWLQRTKMCVGHDGTVIVEP